VKIQEIREHSDEQLLTELAALERRLFDLRAQGATEKIQATSELGKARKDIARIKTVMQQRLAATATEAQKS
jgi:large subunit ribosomal protein L29